jgi:hypothetical protein
VLEIRLQTADLPCSCSDFVLSSPTLVGLNLPQPCTAPHCQPPLPFWRCAGFRGRSGCLLILRLPCLKNGWEIDVLTWPGISGRIFGLGHWVGAHVPRVRGIVSARHPWGNLRGWHAAMQATSRPCKCKLAGSNLERIDSFMALAWHMAVVQYRSRVDGDRSSC